MRPLLTIILVFLATFAVAEEPLILINQPCPPVKALSVLHFQESLVGKSLPDVVGPAKIQSIIICKPYANLKFGKNDAEALKARILKARCLGPVNTVGWHCAPWSKAYLRLKSGNTYEIEVMLSGIMINSVIFN